MGRTFLTHRRAIEFERSRWKNFRNALREDDRLLFDSMFDQSLLYASGGMFTPTFPTFEIILLTILLSHESRLEELEKNLEHRKYFYSRLAP